MSPRVAILTPATGGASFGSRWPEVLPRLAAPLEAAGLAVESRSWASSEDLGGFDLVLPLLAWGYYGEGDWVGQVARWEAEGVRLLNPPEVLRWNADKTYLGRLARKGAPIVPTFYVDIADDTAMASAAKRFGAARLVAKPQVSAGAFRTIRWSPGDSLEGGPEGPAIIQPYLPAIETGGEVSMIYFGGAFSHAIRKRPQPGDFRVQPEYDGIIAPHDPLPDDLKAARAVLDAAGPALLYARVDLVRDLDGRPALMELELVEPDLYLQFSPSAPGAFARAVAAAA